MKPIERRCGTAVPPLVLGGIVLATVLDPRFSWTGDPLSALGVRDASALAFNGSLIVGGLVAFGYVYGLWRLAKTWLERLTAATFGGAIASMIGVGVFPVGEPLHVPAAVAFYLLFSVAFVFDGLERRSTTGGRVTLALVAGHVGIWITWGAGLWPGSGLALPEFAGALVLAAWVWAVGPWPAAPFYDRQRTHASSDEGS